MEKFWPLETTDGIGYQPELVLIQASDGAGQMTGTEVNGRALVSQQLMTVGASNTGSEVS